MRMYYYNTHLYYVKDRPIRKLAQKRDNVFKIRLCHQDFFT